MNESIKKLLLQSTVIAGMMGAAYAAPVYAQDAGANDDDEIVVTGSRIVRKDNYTAIGPVNVIGSDDIDISAKATLGDLLEELPSVSFVGDGTNVNNGSAGLQTINLRGLGADRLLILMNGRRVSPVGSGTGNLVDLQIFPQAAVERIEILKDGAAAVYGADAISGVLNIITTKDFEGLDLTARVGASDKGDGEQFNIGATFGTSTDKGSLMATVSYNETEGVYQSDREISDCPRLDPGLALWVNSFGGGFADYTADPLNTCSGSSFTPNGRFWLGPVAAGPDRSVNAAGDVTQFDFFQGDAYNFNPLNYLRTPNTGLSAFVTADYEITDNITASLELLYNKRRSKQDLAPVPMGSGAQFTYGLLIPGSNPYNIVNPGTDLAYRKRMLDVGARLFDQESDTIRVVGALQGDFNEDGNIPFFSGARWNASWTGDYNSGTDKNGNLIDMLRVQNALDVEAAPTGPVTVGGIPYQCADATARQLGCVPLNLFGPNSITPAAADYIRLNTVDKISSNGTVAQATLANSLFTLPAGDVGAVIGVEYRTVEGKVDVDAAIANGLSSGNPQRSTTGKITAYDYFGEIEVPLIADKPFFQELTLDGAYRISDYDSFKAGNTYRIGAAWSPVKDLRFRGGVATSYRTPSLNQLFGGGAGGFPVYSDPCAVTIPDGMGGTNPDGRDSPACIAQGVGPGSGFAQSNQQVLSFTVGARTVGEDLLAERGKTYTLGAVYRPSAGFLGDLNFEAALDYFDITIRDSIETTGTATTINNCYINNDPLACAAITRIQGGDINIVNTSWTNAPSAESESTEGIDFSFRGEKEFWKGDIGLDVRGTYLLENIDTDIDGFVSDFTGRCFSLGSFACSNEWRINGSLSYATDNLRAVWSTRYLSGIKRNGTDSDGIPLDRQGVIDYYTDEYGVDLTSVDGVVDSYFIKDYFYHDVNVRYSFDNDFQFTAGIDNLFDKKAPVYKALDATFDPTENSPVGTYDTLGRFLYVGFDKKF